MPSVMTIAPAGADGACWTNNNNFNTAWTAAGEYRAALPIQIGMREVSQYYIYRGAFRYDTSVLAGKYIISAFIRFTKTFSTFDGADILHLMTCTGIDTTINDYATVKTTGVSIGSITSAAFTALGVGETFNLTVGTGNINTAGWSDFGLRTQNDIDGTTPPDDFMNEFIVERYVNGVTEGPTLFVTYLDSGPGIAGYPLIEQAFNQPIFTDPTVATWTDITLDVMSLNTKRGRMHELDRVEAGTAVITVDNSDGDYWRYNTSGAFYTSTSDAVKPLTLTRITAFYNAAAYPIYYGYTESLQPSWVGDKGDKNPVMTLQCVDFFKSFTRYYLSAATPGGTLFASELSGTRINNVLDEIGFPTTMRNVTTGVVTVQALVPPVGGTNAMEHLYKVAEAEQGIIFISPSGSVNFHAQNTRQLSPYASSSATFDAVS